MIWFTWRQHRGEALGIAALLSVLGLVVLVSGIPMHRAYERDGVATCQQPGNAADETCIRVMESFRAEFLALPSNIAPWLPFLPAIAGILIGVPLLAREYEHGTWQLVWTQGVPRSRWLLAKLALVLSAVTVAAVAFSAMVSWWFGPMARHRFTMEKFDHAVLVFPSYVLLAVAIGILSGAVIKRTIPAMAVALPAFLLIRIPVEFVLRPHYRTPVTAADTAQADAEGWIVNEQISGPANSAEQTISVVKYHPADRFWEFQLIETAIFAGLAAVLIAIAFWLVARVRR